MAGVQSGSIDEGGARPIPVLTASQQANLAQRLGRGWSDRSDRGQLLPLTAAALEMSADADRGAARLEALAQALGSERVIAPIDVEPDPRITGVHAGADTGGRPEAQWTQIDTACGSALAIFSHAAALAAYNPQARPMPVEFHKVALTALRDSGGRILLNPAGEAVFIPRPLTAALAQGDTWVPPWRDRELADQLRDIAGEDIRDIHLDYGGGDRLLITLDIDPALASDPRGKDRITAAVQALSAAPRLGVAVGQVEFIPRLAGGQ